VEHDYDDEEISFIEDDLEDVDESVPVSYKQHNLKPIVNH
jgi:hypothetical protein